MAYANRLNLLTQTLASGTTYDIDMPATVNDGDGIVVVIRINDNESMDDPTGWVTLLEFTGSGGRTFIYERDPNGDGSGADGTEGGTTVTFSQDAGPEAADGYAQVFHFENGTWTDVEANSGGEQDTANPDPPAHSPAWGAADTTWIQILAWQAAAEPLSINELPDNYTNEERQTGGSGQLNTTWREANTATEDAGTYTLSTDERVAVGNFAVQGTVDSTTTGMNSLVGMKKRM